MISLVLACFITVAVSQCPWSQQGVLRWSQNTPGQWTVPSFNASVVINGGKKVLLDISTPRLNSITIQNGSLIWDDVDNIELITNSLLIGDSGSFEIGSETCLFTKKAIITLTGMDGVGPSHFDFGRKYIGVDVGGTLELHGKDPSPSWTQLAATASSDRYILTNGGRGLTFAVFNQTDGRFLESRVFDTYGNANASANMTIWLNSLPAGRVVACAAMDSAEANLNNASFLAIESLGSNLIRNISFRGSFALIGIKGAAKGTVWEAVRRTGNGSVIVNKTFAAGELGPGSQPFTISVRSAGWADGNINSINKIGNPNPIITLITNVAWQPGDKIVLASTDFSYLQSEEATLISCPECASNQVKLSAPLQYMHFGEIVFGVDMRGEVGLLTRSIYIRGEMSNSCYQTSPTYLCQLIPYDTFGGHLRIANGFKNVHIENVEFDKMGQQSLGFYPIHFHMCGDVDQQGGYTRPAYVKKCSIHHSFARCITIHATNGLLVQGNVGFDSLGHCYFLEDGIEMRNVLDGNLGMLTRPGTLLPSDRDSFMCRNITPTDFNGNPTDVGDCNGISTFWITNPANDLINNVAAGSFHTGIWFVFPDRPTGPSYTMGQLLNIYPQRTPLGRFINNKAHSNGVKGLMFDDGIKTTQPSASQPQQFLAMTGMRYKPRVDPTNPNSARAPAVLQGFTTYKNRERGVWVRGGEFRFVDYRSADQNIGITLASEGTHPNDPGSSQRLDGGIFVGDSNNVGTAGFGVATAFGRTVGGDVRFPMRGFEVYDGPISASNVSFYNFFPNSNRNASAIGYLLSNNWQLSPWNNISDATFDNSLRVYLLEPGIPYWGARDGDVNAIFRDVTGSVSGIIGASVVSPTPFFNTYRCTPRPQWATQVCHEKYGQVYIYNTNSAATNFNGTMGGVIMFRDERPTYRHVMQGAPTTGTNPRNTFQPVLVLGKTYTLHWPHPSPPNVQLQIVNFNIGDWVRIGVCYPANAALNFNVVARNGSTALTMTRVNSISLVDSGDGNNYFFDNSTGLLFVKLLAKNSRIGDEYCGERGCETITIQASGAALGTNTGLCNAYPTYAVTEYVPPNPGCIGELDRCGICNGDGRSCGSIQATTGRISSVTSGAINSITTGQINSITSGQVNSITTGELDTVCEGGCSDPNSHCESGHCVCNAGFSAIDGVCSIEENQSDATRFTVACVLVALVALF